MRDLRDVIAARSEADRARRDVATYGGNIEDGQDGDAALATLLSATLIAAELRALAVTIDYAAPQQ